MTAVGQVPFEPRRPDGRAYWRVVYDYIVDCINDRTLNLGDLIPHTALRGLFESGELSSYYLAVGRAAEELRQVHNRSLRSERGAGYRLIAGTAQVDQGVADKEKSGRVLQKAVAKVATADQALMTVMERNTADATLRGLAALLAVSKLTVAKLAAHEEQLIALQDARVEDRARQQASEEDIAEVRQQLDELRRRLDT